MARRSEWVTPIAIIAGFSGAAIAFDLWDPFDLPAHLKGAILVVSFALGFVVAVLHEVHTRPSQKAIPDAEWSALRDSVRAKSDTMWRAVHALRWATVDIVHRSVISSDEVAGMARLAIRAGKLATEVNVAATVVEAMDKVRIVDDLATAESWQQSVAGWRDVDAKIDAANAVIVQGLRIYRNAGLKFPPEYNLGSFDQDWDKREE